MVELKTTVIFEPARHLLRASFLADQCFDQDPGGGFSGTSGPFASAPSRLMDLLGSINFLLAVAPQFSANRGFKNFDNSCDFCLVMSSFRKCIKIDSLFSSVLRVGSHQCFLDFGRY